MINSLFLDRSKKILNNDKIITFRYPTPSEMVARKISLLLFTYVLIDSYSRFTHISIKRQAKFAKRAWKNYNSARSGVN